MKVSKQLFVERLVDGKNQLLPLTDTMSIKVGERIVVRISIQVDRDLSYVHLKDARAAGLEPKVSLSGYRYRSGLGYYESITDVATHFFMAKLSRGTYVLEYELRANAAGEYASGNASLESMYAPQYNANSQGRRIRIK